MRVVELSDPAEFLERAAPLLLEDEARHNLILGIAGTVRDHPTLYAEYELWLVEEAGSAVAAALRTPPYNLVLGNGTPAGLDALARGIGGSIPGAVGAVPEIDAFVAACAAAHGITPAPRVQQGIYALDEVVWPPRPVGQPRPAGAADRDLLVRWWGEFGRESLGALETDAEQDARNVDQRLSSPTAGIELWDVGGEPVSVVAYGSPTPTGIRIGPVYTPGEHRNRGYASALTAHVSAARLAAGRSFCFLYTDLGNPTSNRIYAAIGYRRVCDSIQYAFV